MLYFKIIVMLFGEYLYNARKKNYLSAEELAMSCGISRSYITLIENNKRAPGKKIIPKIAAALQLKTVVVLNWYLEDMSQKIKKSLLQ